MPICLRMWILAALCFLAASIASATAAEEQSAGVTIGIDLGTTYSCASVARDGSVDLIANVDGEHLIPSWLVCSDDGSCRVGSRAKRGAVGDAAGVVFDAKRLLGRSFDDAIAANHESSGLWPFGVVNRNGNPAIQPAGTNVTLAPEQVSGLVLQEVKAMAEASLGQPVTAAVITVPAYFSNAAREATRDAAALAGLEVRRLIHEPTAAAIAYGLDGVYSEERMVLVYDLGGGTLDVTLLEADDRILDIMATSGDAHLGGQDFDERVMRHAIDSTPGLQPVWQNATALQRLRLAVEKGKIALSSQGPQHIQLPDLLPGVNLDLNLNRATFDRINQDLFDRAMAPVHRVLRDAGVSPKEVQDVVLVGGSSRLPKVRELLADLFGHQALRTEIDPDEAVARGAAVQAAVLDDRWEGDLLLLDATPLTLGIETTGGVMAPLVKRNEHIPVVKKKVFSTVRDDQRVVSINVFEGERARTRDNALLGTFELDGIAPAPRGVPQIEVTFRVDTDGILEVTAAEVGQGAAGAFGSITVLPDAPGRLSRAEMQRMLAVAKHKASEDGEWQRRQQQQQQHAARAASRGDGEGDL